MAYVSPWRIHADMVLARLFATGEVTRRMLIDAYPFGERKQWPYKVWLRRVRDWKAARAVGLTFPQERTPRRRPKDPRQLDLL